jgi:uncharacterized protein (TIGR02246 family)
VTHPVSTEGSKSSDAHGQVQTLYRELLNCWNDRDAASVAALFTEDGNLIGFDGSQINGREEVKSVLQQIFGDHSTATYVGKVRGVRFLTPEVSVLRAVAGMVPPGQSDINPAVNTIHTLISMKQGGQWRIAVFQNTPAAFHGRPELAKQLTEELRETLCTSMPKDDFRNG